MCVFREERMDIVHNYEMKLRKNMDEVFGIITVNGTENGPFTWPVYKERFIKMSIYKKINID